ncbi:MAG: GntR family transcriptional regulator [Candidatus Eremiobacteraeota bacterium]|nr:GntR family transcriptional regulator [Candidatus Eremiobacteraeota bacterium]
MPSPFSVDPRSGVPMYLQLIEQVKRLVAMGALGPGEQLPTVKQLALDLTINPNTVARAYHLLERDGVIETSPGRGSFVRSNGVVTDVRRNLDDVARSALERAVREGRSLGLGAHDLRALFDAVLQRWFPETREDKA